MSSVEYLREFINERLTAAAEEIFRVFHKNIVECEEEIDRQRKLLDVVLKPKIKLPRVELPQQHVCKEEEEVPVDQPLCIKERSSSLDQEDPEPPQMEEEQEELCTNQEGEQFELKQEVETFMLTLTHEESDHSEDQTLDLNADETRRAAEKEPVVNMPVPHISHVSERDQKGGEHGDSGSTRNTEPQSQESLHKCDTCEKDFKWKSQLQNHMRSHMSEKPYSCKTCGKGFKRSDHLKIHRRIHTGEKPYSCETCGKAFIQSSQLIVHMRTHTGEKPYSCTTCGKRFTHSYALKVHMATHTDKKLYSCKTCRKGSDVIVT